MLIVAVIFVSLPFGVYVMVAGSAVLSLLSTVINAWPNKVLLNYSFKEQWQDIMPSFLLASAMSGVLLAVSLLPLGDGLMITIQILVGMAFYYTGASPFKFECLTYLLNTIKGIRADSPKKGGR